MQLNVKMKEMGKGKKEYPPPKHTLATTWLDSESHKEIRNTIEERVAATEIFGKTWKEYLGFFAPFGTDNSFWSRLQKSPMLRHFFVHDKEFGSALADTTLSENGPDIRVTAPDVDAAVNNCALICALLLSIPFGVISNLSEKYINVHDGGSAYKRM
jgi:hypothetical protein